ncbi:MAG: hypothetical protein ACKO38_20390 [Planctomycetota bacterium]
MSDQSSSAPLMTTIAPVATEPSRTSALAPTWVAVLDRWTEWAGERINPILIKEARQSLKSHHFVTTFMLLLVGAWGWSFLAILSGMPEIAYNGGGPNLLVGYLWVLLVPLMLIVPFSAFRSLAAEREDGTFELMAITALNARMIVTGKLASAVLQILLYTSALAPGISFTYLLRGVDIAMIAFVLYYTVVLSILLAIAGLLLATLSRARHWQVLLSIVLIAGLFLALFTWGVFASQAVYQQLFGFDPAFDREWAVHTALACGAVSFGVLMIQTAASRITFASDNRSTRQRVTVIAQFAMWVGWMGYGYWVTKESDFLFVLQSIAGLYAVFIGGWLIGESPTLSPRVRRELPRSVFSRILFTLLNPGSGTGFLFTAATLSAVTAMSVGLQLAGQARGAAINSNFTAFAALILGYGLGYLGLARLAWIAFRRYWRVPGELALLLLVLFAIMGIAFPLAVEVALASSNYIEYSPLQASNWVWTLERAADGDLLAFEPIVPFAVVAIAALIVLANLATSTKEVRIVMESD